jgi:hypothetical protein
MFKTGVIGTGIHKIGEPKLADIPQALDGRGVQERQEFLVHFHVAMDRVLDNLGIH